MNILTEWGDKLDCHSCDETLKRERGHDTDGIIPYLIDGKRVFRCPLMMITPLSYEYIKAFSFYEKGYLPNGVAWNKESNKFCQAMAIVENYTNKLSNKELKKVNNGKHSRP